MQKHLMLALQMFLIPMLAIPNVLVCVMCSAVEYTECISQVNERKELKKKK